MENNNWTIFTKGSLNVKKVQFQVCLPSELQDTLRKLEIYTTEERKLGVGKDFGDEDMYTNCQLRLKGLKTIAWES